MRRNDKVSYGKHVKNKDVIFFAPLGTPIDPDPFKIPHENAIGLGIVSSEGDKKTPGYGDKKPVPDMNGVPVLYEQGEYEPKIEANLMQTANDFEIDKVVYGDENVIGVEGNYKVLENESNGSRGVIVIDHEFDNKSRERQVYKDANIQLSGEIVNNKKDPRVFPITITPIVDSDTGNACETYKKDFVEAEG